MNEKTRVRPHRRRNKKDKGTHRVKGHTRRVNPKKEPTESPRNSLKGGARRHERKYIEQIEDMGHNVITDPEEVYWHDMYDKSFALMEKIDIRQKYKKKPVIIETDDMNIMIEWDYGHDEENPGGWIIYNDRGDVISKEDRKFFALMEVKYYLEDW